MTRERTRTPPTQPVVQARVRARAVQEEIVAKVLATPRTRVPAPVVPTHAEARTRTRVAVPAAASPAKGRVRVAPPKKAEHLVEDPDTGEPMEYIPPAPPGKPVWWQPGLPDVWPNGSALMTGPGMPGYKEHTRKIGEPDENNPNLRGRWLRDADKYVAYRWLPKHKRYRRIGEYLTTMSALIALR